MKKKSKSKKSSYIHERKGSPMNILSFLAGKLPLLHIQSHSQRWGEGGEGGRNGVIENVCMEEGGSRERRRGGEGRWEGGNERREGGEERRGGERERREGGGERREGGGERREGGEGRRGQREEEGMKGVGRMERRGSEGR